MLSPPTHVNQEASQARWKAYERQWTALAMQHRPDLVRFSGALPRRTPRPRHPEPPLTWRTIVGGLLGVPVFLMLYGLIEAVAWTFVALVLGL